MTRFHAHLAISLFLIFCFAGFGTDNLTYATDQSSNSGEGAPPGLLNERLESLAVAEVRVRS